MQHNEKYWKEYTKEKREHPTLPLKDIRQIVRDHLAIKRGGKPGF